MNRNQAILQWYAAGTQSDDRTAHPEPSSAGNVIVALGEEFVPAAEYASARLKRPIIHADTRSLSRQLERQSASTALVVGPLTMLETASLGVLDIATRESDCTLGLLVGRSPASLEFSVEKLAALSHMAPRSDALIDVDAMASAVREPDGRWAAQSFAAGLGGDHSTLSILSHSGGGHMVMANHVVCGLLDEYERLDDGRLLDGCGPDRCKFAPTAASRIHRAGDLRAATMALMGCNTASGLALQYPSNTSLILAATEGYAANVLAFCVGDVPLDPPDLQAWSSALSAGVPLGAIARQLDERLRGKCIYRTPPCVLVGDPAHRAVVSNRGEAPFDTASPDSVADPPPQSPTSLARLVEAGSVTIGRKLASLDVLVDALIDPGALVDRGVAGKCDFCLSPTRELGYVDALIGARRRRLACPRCGPLEDGPADGFGVAIRMPARSPGRVWQPSIRVSAEPGPPEVRVMLRAKDCVLGREVASQGFTTDGPGEFSFDLVLEDELAPESHHLWVTACRGTDVAFAHCRTASIRTLCACPAENLTDRQGMSE